MSEDTNQDDGALFAPETPEGGSDPASTTPKETEENPEGEENKEETLDLEEGTASKEEQKLKQLDVMERKIKNGEMTIDDLPTRQKWMKADLEGRLDLSAKTEAKAEELDVEALLDEKLANRDAEARFRETKKRLDSVKLTADQKKEVTTEFKEFRSMGASKDVALEKALKVANVDLDAKPQRKDMDMPLPRAYKEPDGIDIDTPYSEIRATVPEAKRLAHLKKLAGM